MGSFRSFKVCLMHKKFLQPAFSWCSLRYFRVLRSESLTGDRDLFVRKDQASNSFYGRGTFGYVRYVYKDVHFGGMKSKLGAGGRKSGASLFIPQHREQFVSVVGRLPPNLLGVQLKPYLLRRVQFWRPTEFGLSMRDEDDRHRPRGVSQYPQTIKSLRHSRQLHVLHRVHNFNPLTRFKEQDLSILTSHCVLLQCPLKQLWRNSTTSASMISLTLKFYRSPLAES